MYITSRSYLTAGIAALGVGAIALAPVQPVPALDQDRVTRSLAAALANESTPIDPITPWVDTFETSAANIQALFDFYASNPNFTSPLGLEGNFSAVFPLLQTIIANQITYVEELFNGNAGLIPEQIWNNVQTFFQAPWNPGAIDPDSGNYIGEYVSQTVVTAATIGGVPVLPINQQFAFQLLPSVLGDSFADIKPIVDFTATYYSGQLVGLLGPLFAPLIELTRSFTAIGAFFEAGDVTGAINELINIPANVTNAVLNGGGVLDLTGVANAITPLPPELKSIGLNLGGLISPPVPQDGSLIDPTDPPTTFNGGVLFDSVAAEIDYKLSPVGPTALVQDPGIPVSWIGAAVGLGQFLGGEMLVTPPAPPTEAAAVTAAAEVEIEVEAAGLEAAVDEAPADEAPEAPADEAPEAPADEAPEAPADELKIDDVVADDEPAAPKAAAAVDAPAPSKAAAGSASDDAGDSDSDSRGSDSRRGASNAD
jgi:hypothetical protein